MDVLQGVEADTGVPVGKVFSSQFNRAYQTAVLAGFKGIQTTADLSEGGLVVTPDENNRRAHSVLSACWGIPAAGH